MLYIVPQFIERETRIAGPLTFKQLIILVVSGSLSVLAYFLLPFYLFLLAAIGLMGSGLALAFLKIEGFSLPTVIINFFVFLSRSRLYLWHRKDLPPKIAQKREVLKTEIKESSVLKVSDKKSKISELLTFLETKTK
jgi:hypothetical protein